MCPIPHQRMDLLIRNAIVFTPRIWTKVPFGRYPLLGSTKSFANPPCNWHFLLGRCSFPLIFPTKWAIPFTFRSQDGRFSWALPFFLLFQHSPKPISAQQTVEIKQ